MKKEHTLESAGRGSSKDKSWNAKHLLKTSEAVQTQ